MPHMEMDTIKFDFNEILQVYVILLTVVQTGSINHFFLKTNMRTGIMVFLCLKRYRNIARRT